MGKIGWPTAQTDEEAEAELGRESPRSNRESDRGHGGIKLSRRSKSSPKPTRKTSPPKTHAATTQKQKRRPYTLSEENLYVIRIETERYFWRIAFKRLSRTSETWRAEVDRTLLPWRATEAAEFKKAYKLGAEFKVAHKLGRKKAKSPPPAPPLELPFHEVSGFAASYGEVVDSAAGHLADLLAQAMAFRQGLGHGQQKWIQGKIEEFAKEKLSCEVVRGWIGVAISNPPEAEKLPGFDCLVEEICSHIHRPPVLFEATHKLKLAVALMGEEKARLVRTIPRGVLTLEDLQKQKKKSCSQAEAASVLHCGDRTIRTFISDKKLNATESGRVVVDDKLSSLSRLTDSPAKK